MIARLWLPGIVLLALAGCASSKVSMAPAVIRASHPVQVIAMAPGGGLLADAVAVELSNRGYMVIDPAATSNLMVRINLSEVEVARPEGLMKLKDQGVDAYLTVRAAGSGDNRPDSASARLVSTHNNRLIAGVSWQNGWGGMEGSVADRTMRKGLSEAAIEIAEALGKSMPGN